MLESDDGLQRLLDVSDKERAAAEADKAPPPKKKKGPPPRDYKYPAPTKEAVLAKLGATSGNKIVRSRDSNDLTRFRAALKGVEASFLKRISWVANNLGADLGDFGDDEPPDFASVKHLQWANQNEDLFRQLYDSKLMPSKAELESIERTKDDGRALTLIEGLEKEFYEKKDEAA
jgi:hypothetical protein